LVNAKFEDKVKSKNKAAQENELPCKFMVHNIIVLILVSFELERGGVDFKTE
jgi:hypothetical protein